MEAIVSPEGEIVISTEVTSALDLKAGDRVSLTMNGAGVFVAPKPAAEPPPVRHVSPNASLEEKVAFYSSPVFIDAVSEHFRKARAAVARDDATNS